jgi:hypothetical protein
MAGGRSGPLLVEARRSRGWRSAGAGGGEGDDRVVKVVVALRRAVVGELCDRWCSGRGFGEEYRRVPEPKPRGPFPLLPCGRLWCSASLRAFLAPWTIGRGSRSNRGIKVRALEKWSLPWRNLPGSALLLSFRMPYARASSPCHL